MLKAYFGIVVINFTLLTLQIGQRQQGERLHGRCLWSSCQEEKKGLFQQQH